MSIKKKKIKKIKAKKGNRISKKKRISKKPKRSKRSRGPKRSKISKRPRRKQNKQLGGGIDSINRLARGLNIDRTCRLCPPGNPLNSPYQHLLRGEGDYLADDSIYLRVYEIKYFWTHSEILINGVVYSYGGHYPGSNPFDTGIADRQLSRLQTDNTKNYKFSVFLGKSNGSVPSVLKSIKTILKPESFTADSTTKKYSLDNYSIWQNNCNHFSAEFFETVRDPEYWRQHFLAETNLSLECPIDSPLECSGEVGSLSSESRSDGVNEQITKIFYQLTGGPTITI